MCSKLIVLAVAAACVFAAPSTDVVPLEKQQPTVIPIISQSDELEANGTYKFSYETGNGIKREEEAYEKVLPKAEGRSASSNEASENDEDSNEIHVQRGSYSYTAPDGTVITLSYIADENGFQPIGDHIPRAPVPAQPAASSSDKSGRALKPVDGAVSASEPKKEEKPAPAPLSPAASAGNLDNTANENTTENTKDGPVANPEPKDNSAEPISTTVPSQSTSAEITEVPVSTAIPEQDTSASSEKQTTINPITEATSQSTDAEIPSTNAPKPVSEEEISSTTVSA